MDNTHFLVRECRGLADKVRRLVDWHRASPAKVVITTARLHAA